MTLGPTSRFSELHKKPTNDNHIITETITLSDLSNNIIQFGLIIRGKLFIYGKTFTTI